MELWSTLLACIAILVIIFELYCSYTEKYPTLSVKIVEWTVKYPLLPFFFGLLIGTLAGHFWPITGHCN